MNSMRNIFPRRRALRLMAKGLLLAYRSNKIKWNLGKSEFYRRILCTWLVSRLQLHGRRHWSAMNTLDSMGKYCQWQSTRTMHFSPKIKALAFQHIWPILIPKKLPLLFLRSTSLSLMEDLWELPLEEQSTVNSFSKTPNVWIRTALTSMNSQVNLMS